MAFHHIDMETWPRREHFQYYSEKLRTSYQLNVELDVTALVSNCAEAGYRFYPSMIYVIMRAIRDSRSDCELIANLWGWSSFMDWSEEQTMHGIELLDKDISVMFVSEYEVQRYCYIANLRKDMYF